MIVVKILEKLIKGYLRLNNLIAFPPLPHTHTPPPHPNNLDILVNGIKLKLFSSISGRK